MAISTRLVRFNYYNGEKSVCIGDVKKITVAGRVIADAGGISVFQGIKLRRILRFDFNQVNHNWWVLMCFEDQRHIGERLFNKRVKKLEIRRSTNAI